MILKNDVKFYCKFNVSFCQSTGSLGKNHSLLGSQDGSFISSGSSTESDSLPFANENAGTIKQRSGRNMSGELCKLFYFVT